MKFLIEFEESSTGTIKIDANNKDEAREKAEEEFSNGNIQMDNNYSHSIVSIEELPPPGNLSGIKRNN